jgi:NADPH:quinone reductase-like Zn-dependent oxidoreductase
VRIHASTVNRTDCGFLAADPWIVRFFSGLRRPRQRILGNELAGVVEQVGAQVTDLAVGDRVFGVDQSGFGTHAESHCMRPDEPIVRIPDGLSFAEAAATPDGFVLATTCLTGAKLRAGQRILIYGATGSIGTAAVQIAHDMRAHVTAVADSRTIEVVRCLGADVVVDRSSQDFRELGETWDIVFDAVGKLSFFHCRRVIRRGGPYVTTDLGRFWHAPLLALTTRVTSRLGTKRLMIPIPSYRRSHMERLSTMLSEGRYRAVVDRHYPLEDIVEATRFVCSGQKVGNVVIDIGP